MITEIIFNYQEPSIKGADRKETLTRATQNLKQLIAETTSYNPDSIQVYDQGMSGSQQFYQAILKLPENFR